MFLWDELEEILTAGGPEADGGCRDTHLFLNCATHCVKTLLPIISDAIDIRVCLKAFWSWEDIFEYNIKFVSH